MRPATPCTALQDVTFVRLRFWMVYDFRGEGERDTTEERRLGSWGPRAAAALAKNVGKKFWSGSTRFYSQTSPEMRPVCRIMGLWVCGRLHGRSPEMFLTAVDLVSRSEGNHHHPSVVDSTPWRRGEIIRYQTDAAVGCDTTAIVEFISKQPRTIFIKISDPESCEPGAVDVGRGKPPGFYQTLDISDQGFWIATPLGAQPLPRMDS